MELRQFNLGKFLGRIVVGLMVAVTLFLVVAAYYVTIQIAKESLPLFYLDSASEIGSRLLNLTDNHGGNVKMALQKTLDETALAIPGVSLVLAETNGRVFDHVGSCRVVQSTISSVELESLSNPSLTENRSSISSPCQNLALYSTALVALPNRDIVLYVLGPQTLLDYATGFDGLLIFLQHCLLPALFLLAGALLLLAFNYLNILQHAAQLANCTREFLKGRRNFRISSFASAEFAEIAETLDKLADEHQSGLQQVESDIVERQVLTANMLHDLLTPITAMQSATEMLMQLGLDSEKSGQYLNYLNVSLDAEQKLAEGLRELASIDEAALSFSPEPVDIYALVARLKTQISPLAESGKLNLELISNTSNTVAECDEQLISRCILNLLSNAVRFTPPGGTIRLIIEELNEFLVVKISDTGIGIPENEIEKVFGDFYRTAQGKNHAPGGSGVGLATVRRIIALHHANIDLQSRPLLGTTFAVRLSKIYRAVSSIDSPELVSKLSILENDIDSIKRLPLSSRMVGLMVAFCGVLTVLAISSGQEPSTIWLSVASFLCSAWVAWSFVRQSKSRSRLRTGIAFGVLCLLVAVTLIETSEIVLVMAGVAVVCSSAYLVSATRNRYSALLPLISASIAYNFADNEAGIGIGLMAGFILGGGAWFQDRIPMFRRIGWKTAGLLFFFTMVMAWSLSFGIWICSHRIAALAPKQAVREILKVRTDEYHNGLLSRSDFRKMFADFERINPYFDYELFFVSGYGSVNNFSALSTQGSAYPPFSRPQSVKDPSSEMSIFEGQVPVNTQRLLSILYSLGFCSKQSPELCLDFALQTPGGNASHLLNRLITNQLVVFQLFAPTFSLLLLALAGFVLNLRIRGAFHLVKLGLQRYRCGDYSEKIGLRADNAIGDLFGCLDQLASQLPQLVAEVDRRRDEKSSFMRKMAGELEMSIDALRYYLPHKGSRNYEDSILTYKLKVEEQREVLESMFELQRLELKAIKLNYEPIAVSEIVEEAVFYLSRLDSIAPIAFSSIEVDESLFALGDPTYFSRALNYFACALAADSTYPSLIKIIGHQDSQWVVLKLRIDREQLLDESRLGSEIHDGSSLGYQPAVFKYSWQSMFSEAFTQMGGSVLVNYSATTGTIISLSLPIYKIKLHNSQESLSEHVS